MRHTNAGPAPLFSALSGLLSYLPYIGVYFLFYFFFGQLVRPLPFVSGTGSVVILAVLCLVSLAGSWFLSSWCEGEFPVMLPFVLYAALIYWQDAPFLLICSALSFIFFLGPTARRMLLLWRRTKTYSYRYEQQMERLQTGFAWRFRLLCLALMAFLFVRVQLVPAAAQTTADQPPAQVFYQEGSFESLFPAYRDELGAFAPAVWGSASRSARRQACEDAVAVCCLYLGLDEFPAVEVKALDPSIAASTDGKTVRLNERDVYDSVDSFYVFDSCAHEVFHIYQRTQASLLARLPLTSEDWGLLSLRRVGRYLDELANYQSSATDGYDEQALEQDAQRFASTMTGALQELLAG